MSLITDNKYSICRVTRGIPKYNIQIGPLADALKYNAAAIVSVTDHFAPALVQIPHTYWIPVHERARSWGIMPFFASKQILDTLTKLDMGLIYLCCSGGKNRSPLIAFCWMLSLGYTEETAVQEFVGHFEQPVLDHYRKHLNLDYLPLYLPSVYQLMTEHPDWSLGGIFEHLGIKERITYTR